MYAYMVLQKVHVLAYVVSILQWHVYAKSLCQHNMVDWYRVIRTSCVLACHAPLAMLVDTQGRELCTVPCMDASRRTGSA